MSSFLSVSRGFVIMLVCILIGVVISMAGGRMMDSLQKTAVTRGFFDDAFNNQYHASQNFDRIADMFRALMYLIPLLGIGIFVVSIISRYRQDEMILPARTLRYRR